MNSPLSQVCIVGAGPAGTSASMMLSQLKIPHIIIDKEIFPRDKTCGDGLIMHVFKSMRLLKPDLLKKFLAHPKFVYAETGRFNVTDKLSLAMQGHECRPFPPMFYGKRIDFDAFLLRESKSPFQTQILGNGVSRFEYVEEGLRVVLKDGKQLHCPFVIGADGIQSVVSRTLAKNKIDRKRTSTFISAYFKGMEGFNKMKTMKIKLVYNKMPLFFYIFPLPNGEANVSLGGLSVNIQKNKINLKKEIENILSSHKVISCYFKCAERTSPWRGWGIPCHFGKQTIYGDRFLLTGDAAGLANPLYKEGVGTSMMSGIIAAKKVAVAWQHQNFTSAQLSDYPKLLKQEFGRQLFYSKLAFKATHYRWLLACVVFLFAKPISKRVNAMIGKYNYS